MVQAGADGIRASTDIKGFPFHRIRQAGAGQIGEQASASSRQTENSHQCLHDEQRTVIGVFAASGEQVAERTLITANRAGQIGNDVIKMCTGGQRKTFLPV